MSKDCVRCGKDCTSTLSLKVSSRYGLSSYIKCESTVGFIITNLEDFVYDGDGMYKGRCFMNAEAIAAYDLCEDCRRLFSVMVSNWVDKEKKDIEKDEEGIKWLKDITDPDEIRFWESVEIARNVKDCWIYREKENYFVVGDTICWCYRVAHCAWLKCSGSLVEKVVHSYDKNYLFKLICKNSFCCNPEHIMLIDRPEKEI